MRYLHSHKKQYTRLDKTKVNVEAIWLECPELENKPHLLILSARVVAAAEFETTDHDVLSEWEAELKCSATGKPGELLRTLRRCSLKRSRSRLPVSPMYKEPQRRHMME